MHEWSWLLAQGAFAIMTFVLAAGWVIPALGQLRQPELMLDVWLPIVIVLPLLAFALHIALGGGSVGGPGWASLGGPGVLAGLIIAVGMLRRPGGNGQVAWRLDHAGGGWWPLRVRFAVATIAAGLILLLLGAAHVMTAFIGNCAFALAAVLLWINTPEPAASNRPIEPVAATAGLAMVGCVIGAGAHAAAAFVIIEIAPGIGTAIAAVIALGAGLGIGIALAAAHGSDAAGRIALWTGSLGVLLGLGVIAFGAILPRAWRLMRDGEEPGRPEVAYGFGTYAFEAVILIFLPATVLFAPRLHRSMRISLGAAMAIGMLVLAAWRVRAIG